MSVRNSGGLNVSSSTFLSSTISPFLRTFKFIALTLPNPSVPLRKSRNPM